MKHSGKMPQGYQKGGRRQGTEIHPSSVKPGSGSGNLYKYAKPSIDKENPPKHPKYGV
jgi:hypothetical protein